MPSMIADICAILKLFKTAQGSCLMICHKSALTVLMSRKEGIVDFMYMSRVSSKNDKKRSPAVLIK
jgi:hypothetical protein